MISQTDPQFKTLRRFRFIQFENKNEGEIYMKPHLKILVIA